MKTILTCTLAGFMLSGCCSYNATKNHNDNIDRKALMMRLDKNEAIIGIDMMGVKGYLGAWKKSPGMMSLATIGDLATGAGLYYLNEKIDENSENPVEAKGVSVVVTDTHSPVVVNIVSGNSNSSNNDENGTGQSNNDVGI